MLHPHIRELVPVGVTRLFFGVFKVDGSFVEPYWCPGFHPACTYAPLCDRPGEVMGSWFCNPSPCNLVMADVHESVEKSSCCYDDGTGTKLHTPYCPDANSLTVLHDELFRLVLPDVKIISVVEHPAPFPDELATIALGAWRPDGRPFAFVEHAELDCCPVRHHCHLPSEGVYLAHNLSFGYTANSRVAAHLRNLVHIHRYEACPGAHVRCCACCLAACVSRPDNDHVVLEIHSLLIFWRKSKKKK